VIQFLPTAAEIRRFSIGKILDAATKEEGGELLFGLTIPQFYGALGAVCDILVKMLYISNL
jgi:hypothetical protein